MTDFIYNHRRKLDFAATVLAIMLLFVIDMRLPFLRIGAIAVVLMLYGYWNYLSGQMHAHAKHDIEWEQDKVQLADAVAKVKRISEESHAILATMKGGSHG